MDAKNEMTCECVNWADESLANRLLTGHHSRCQHGQDPLGAALALIADLAAGIEAWGAMEDGIPIEVWEPYRKAKGLQGAFLSNERS